MHTLHVGSWQELDIQEIIHHLHLFVFRATSTKHGLQHLKGGLLHVHSSCLCNRLWQSRGSSVPGKEEVVTDHSQGAVVFLSEVGVTVVPQVTYEEQSSKTCRRMLPILFQFQFHQFLLWNKFVVILSRLIFWVILGLLQLLELTTFTTHRSNLKI